MVKVGTGDGDDIGVGGRGRLLDGERMERIGNTESGLHRQAFSSVGCEKLVSGVASWEKARGEVRVVGIVPIELVDDVVVCPKAIDHHGVCFL